MQKVLIYDHDELFRDTLGDVLETTGLSVQGVSSPGEAMKYVLKESFAAIVFNIRSDALESIRILSIIKEIDCELPVIAVIESDTPLSLVTNIIHKTFKLFWKPVDYRGVEVAVREAIEMSTYNKKNDRYDQNEEKRKNNFCNRFNGFSW